MDKFVKNFIAMSIVYLAAASVMGVMMMFEPSFAGQLKFVHSHLMLLGWVTMMIYGVGYHILPRFAGKLIKKPGLAMLQFWVANLGLVGMVVFYPMSMYYPEVTGLRVASGLSGALEGVSSFLFLYLMMTTLFTPVEEKKPA